MAKKKVVKSKIVEKKEQKVNPVINLFKSSPIKKLRVVKIKRKYILATVAVVVLSFLVFRFKDLAIAAVVNGQPITRISVVSELEKRSGAEALDSIITQTLVEQEAMKQNVTVSDQEIADETASFSDSLKSSGQDLDSALAMQGLTREDLKIQIRLRLLVNKMLAKDIQVTDVEIADYIKANPDSFPKGIKPEDATKQAKDTLTQQQLSTKVQTWLADLKKNANITYFVKY